MGNGGVDGAAGVDGVVGDGLEDADDAFCVGDDDEREVVNGKLVEEGGVDDEGGGSAEIICSVSWSDGSGCGRWGIRWDGLGKEAIEVGLVAGDGEDRRRELGGHADALGAPVGEQEKRGDGVACREIGQFAGGVEGDEGNGFVWIGGMRGVGEVGERLAEEGVAAASEGDGDGIVGGKGGGKSCVEGGEGCGDGGWRSFIELLEGCKGDAVGVEIVERLRRLGAGIGRGGRCGWCGCREEGEEVGLAGASEGEGVVGVEELHEVDGFVEGFGGEGVVGDSDEHGLCGHEGCGLVLDVELCMDEAGVGLGEQGLGCVGCDVAGGGFDDGREVLTEGAELGEIDEVGAGEGLGIAGGAVDFGVSHRDGECGDFGGGPVGHGTPREVKRVDGVVVGGFGGELRWCGR